MDKKRFVHQTAQIRQTFFAEISLDVFSDLKHADHMVDASLVNRKAAVVLGLDDAEGLIAVCIGIQSRHVHARGQNALHGQVSELQRRGNQLALLLIQASLFRHILNDVVEFVLGDREFRPSSAFFGKSLPDFCQNRREGPEKTHKKAKASCAALGQPLRKLLGNAFRQHLAGKEHNQSFNNRADRHRREAPASGHDHGDQRREEEMADVGADQHGRDRTFKMVKDIKCLLCAGFAPLGGGSHPNARAGGKCGLGKGKINRPRQQQNRNQDWQSTAIVHCGSTTPFLAEINA